MSIYTLIMAQTTNRLDDKVREDVVPHRSVFLSYKKYNSQQR